MIDANGPFWGERVHTARRALQCVQPFDIIAACGASFAVVVRQMYNWTAAGGRKNCTPTNSTLEAAALRPLCEGFFVWFMKRIKGGGNPHPEKVLWLWFYCCCILSFIMLVQCTCSASARPLGAIWVMIEASEMGPGISGGDGWSPSMDGHLLVGTGTVSCVVDSVSKTDKTRFSGGW